jgi:tetratricopeptide (TPR) repeat protein
LAALAASYADIGQFDKAIKWQKKALEGKEHAEYVDYYKGNEKLWRYEEKKPWREE